MTTKNLYFQYFLAYKEYKIWNYANNVYKVFIFCIKKQIGLITYLQVVFATQGFLRPYIVLEFLILFHCAYHFISSFLVSILNALSNLLYL